MATCAHAPPYVTRACHHLLGEADSYTEAFTGAGQDSELLCDDCARAASDVLAICAACEQRVRAKELSAVTGSPAAIDAPSPLRLVHEAIELECPELVDLQPITGADRNRWIGLTADALYELDLDARSARRICATDHGSELLVSDRGRYAAVYQTRGITGAVISLETGAVTFPLVREPYHAEHCDFPIAFVERDGKTLVCFAPLWNRVDLFDAATGELLTPRDEEQKSLDYFHCGLTVSPDQTRIADNGWVWHPVGEVVTWSLEAWRANPWESEDGASKKLLVWRTYFWDGPVAWLDDRRLLVWGYGKDDGQLADAVMIYDTVTGAFERWIGGVPGGAMFVDQHLYVLGNGRLSIWDTERGVRLLEAESSATRYHPDAKVFVSLQLAITRVRGRHAAWHINPALLSDPDNLPVIADALEAAGHDDARMLAHCRAPGPHGAHCWVLDQLRE